MKILLIITNSKMAQRAVPWLAESARRQNYELFVTNCALNQLVVPDKAEFCHLIEEPKKVRGTIKQIISQLLGSNVTLLGEISGEFLEHEVAVVIGKYRVKLVYFPIDAKLDSDALDMQFGQQLLLNSPCDVILLDFGTSERKSIKRIVVPMDLAASGHVIRHILKLRKSKIGVIVPLHISQDFGGDSRKIAAKELDLQLKEVGLTETTSWINPQVVMADSFHEGIVQTVQENDAIILGGSSVKLIHDMRLQLMSIRPQIAEAIPIGSISSIRIGGKNKNWTIWSTP